ncbi:MAG: hypothetical protein LBR11_13305 [Deltaproteobacteria bacterium]|jgi:hypothetical protein|nr:hypothetical protein [Deltaproteobacteria bacterium]
MSFFPNVPILNFFASGLSRLAEIIGQVHRGALLLIGAGVMVVGAVLGYALLSVPASSSTDPLSEISLTPKSLSAEVGGIGAPDYNRLIEEQNQAQASQAEAEGLSFVPTPVGLLTEKTELSSPAGKPQEPDVSPNPPKPSSLQLKMLPAPHAPPVKPPPLPPSPPEKPDPDLEKAILDDLKSILARSDGQLTGPVVSFPEAKEKFVSQNQPRPDHLETTLKPGDLLSATTTLAIDSDINAPALATVTFGPFKGAKLLGKFERGETGAIVTFNRLIPLRGSPLSIEAVAVDPHTSKAAIASKVDDHFFQRWGGLLASGFLEGFGTALGNRGGRIYANGDILIQEQPEKTVRDASLEALGQVGRQAGEQFKKNFERPATIHVNAGQSLGVLILSAQNSPSAFMGSIRGPGS